MNLFKSSFGLKYITFGFVFIIAIFSFSHQAFAKSYSSTCADGGMVNSEVNITPVGPFQVSSQTQTLNAIGRITSTCSTRLMHLKAKNSGDANGGTLTDVIPDGLVYPNIPYPTEPATHIFNVPSTEGTYNVAFATEQEDGTTGGGGSGNYVFLGSTLSTSTSILACTSLGWSSRQIWQAKDIPFPATGIIYYTDLAMKNPILGKSQWFLLNYNYSGNGNNIYAVQINDSGAVINSTGC